MRRSHENIEVQGFVSSQHNDMIAELEDSVIPNNHDNGNSNTMVIFQGSDNRGGSKKRRTLRDDERDANNSDLVPASAAEGSAHRPVEIEDDEIDTGNGGSQDNSWTHEVALETLHAGDQIYVYRGVVQHHGIVTCVPEANALSQLEPHERPWAIQVVHFDSACDGVETIALETFSNGKKIQRARYSAGLWASGFNHGASYAAPADDPSLIVARATEAAKFGSGINGWGGYSLLTNNCETFACWCSTGRRSTLSRQASRSLVGAGVVAASFSACAAASAAAGGFARATSVATAMVPREFQGVRRTVQLLEWTAGTAAVLCSLADMVSLAVTPSPAERSFTQSSSSSVSAMVPPTMD